MVILCMFDLPVETKAEQREYRTFRKKLISEGFYMLQYSVYARVCPNRDYAHAIEKKLQVGLPKAGNVRLITVTEKQFKEMKLLVGKKCVTEEVVGSERIIIL